MYLLYILLVCPYSSLDGASGYLLPSSLWRDNSNTTLYLQSDCVATLSILCYCTAMHRSLQQVTLQAKNVLSWQLPRGLWPPSIRWWPMLSRLWLVRTPYIGWCITSASTAKPHIAWSWPVHTLMKALSVQALAHPIGQALVNFDALALSTVRFGIFIYHLESSISYSKPLWILYYGILHLPLASAFNNWYQLLGGR